MLLEGTIEAGDRLTIDAVALHHLDESGVIRTAAEELWTSSDSANDTHLVTLLHLRPPLALLGPIAVRRCGGRPIRI